MQKPQNKKDASNKDAHKPMPLHKADKDLLLSEIEIIQDNFTYKPHPAQAQFLALQLWQFEQDFGFVSTLHRTHKSIEDLTERMAHSGDPVTRTLCMQQVQLLLSYASLCINILDNPCLFSYHR